MKIGYICMRWFLCSNKTIGQRFIIKEIDVCKNNTIYGLMNLSVCKYPMRNYGNHV